MPSVSRLVITSPPSALVSAGASSCIMLRRNCLASSRVQGCSSASASASLPTDLFQQMRRRVRLLAFFSAIGFALGPLVFFGILLLAVLLGDELPPDFWGGSQFLWLHALAILLSAGLWWRARRASTSSSGLLNMGLLYQIVICLLIGIMTYWSEFRESGSLPRLTWIPAVM